MNNTEKEHYARKVVSDFAIEFHHSRAWQIGQMVPGQDGRVILSNEAFKDPLTHMMEPQEWLIMAQYGLGLIDEDSAYIYEICQGLAEWVFAIPGYNTYDIPSVWYDTPMGALWAAAFIRVQGDELITIAEAAKVADVSVQAISQRVQRGSLQSYTDPTAPSRQGRTLVRRSDVEKKS